MDSTKPSLSSKVPHVNRGRGNESPLDEGSVPWRDSVDGERQRDSENREMDAADGMTAAAEINPHHKGSADKNKFNSLSYQRRTKQKVVSDFATVSKGTSAGAKPRAALRQVLFSQGVFDKNPASEERGQLDVLRQDLEAYAVPVCLKWRWKEESQGTTLEKNWTDLVHSHSSMSKMQRHQQEALWEFVHTELTYINKLIVIKDLVIAALINLNQHGFLLEVTPELLFCNLPSILHAHQLFWQEVIYPMLQEVRRTGDPFDPVRLEAGCLQFHERFSSYQHYCWEEENNLEFTRRQMESNPHFFTYVQWVETHPQCERMRLGDMQAKPHQRITKYPLLLKAVLKTTQDPHVQHTLRGMLSSVNSFLESINYYLKLQDEKLALSISSQRVEGYEVEGINEEIDKHVREICQFDLTCPIRGVGPEVVRKLLLEENLKIRDRKDSKLEVVALLFSDVLLMTKMQKKGERLKVVRPPLALDKTSCIALKDGCSFVVVEVGELQCAMNVYIFAASTSESCSTWVSTIHQAKETLTNLRKVEKNRQMENWKIYMVKPIKEAKIDDTETEEQILEQTAGEIFVDELSEELIIPQPINGMLATKEEEGQYQPANDVITNNNGLPLLQTQPSKSYFKSAHESFAGQQQAVKGYEWIEMGVRGYHDGNHTEEEEKITESQMTREQRVTSHHRAQSSPNLDLFIPSTAAGPLGYDKTGPHILLLGGLPAVDYPTNKDNFVQLSYPPKISREGPEFQRVTREVGITPRRYSQFMNQHTRRNSRYSQTGDMETSSEPWGFSKNLRSPVLKRRRQISIHQGPSTQMSKQFTQGSGDTWAALNNSPSNSDSDGNLSIKKSSVPSGGSDSHRVLKLGSLKPNQGMFWHMRDSVSPDPQTLSEPELPVLNFHSKRPKMKTQRSSSIPNIMIEGGNGLHQRPSSMYTLPQEQDIPFPISGHCPNGHPSPLEGLLERAKERVRERKGLKREQNVKMASLFPSSTTPSSSPSDGDRDTDWEEEVMLMRHGALTVSRGWKEQLVDGDEDDNRNSVLFADGVNVDWPGWCFDDDEVMDHLHTGDEGLLEGITRSLALLDFPEQDDGECSQV